MDTSPYHLGKKEWTQELEDCNHSVVARTTQHDRAMFVVTMWAGISLAACGKAPTTVSPPPTHSTTATITPPAPGPTNSTPKPADSIAMSAATPPPPAPSPIAQLLANPPPVPAMPTRTCPTLPKPEKNVPFPGKRSAVIVTVMDYLSLAPIADVRVNIFHGDRCYRERGCVPSHPHPENELKMTGKTDAQGHIIFDVPDLEYSVYIPEDAAPGHLPFSDSYNLGTQKCHDVSHERRTVNGRTIIFDGYLIPETMVRIRSREDAIASVMQIEALVTWLRGHQDMEMTVRDGSNTWEIAFGHGFRSNRMILVNRFDGKTTMVGSD